MKPETKVLLSRWKNLEDGEGLRKAHSFCRILQVGTIVVGIFIAVAFHYSFPILFVILASLLAGWLIAERNALEVRLKQWPELKQYIDWEKVNRDLQIK